MKDVPVSTQRFAAADGLKLTGDAWGSPEDPPVLLLHGGGQTRHAWSGTAGEIARDGWHAVSLDLRGHGESDWHAEGRYDFASYAADVRALVDALDRPPVLVGASLGGIASLLAVAGAEARCVASALVLVDIGTRMQQEGVERIIAFMQARPEGFASLEEAADAIAEYLPHRPRPRDLSGLAKNLRRRNDGRYRWHWDPRFVEGRSGGPPSITLDQLDAAAAALELPTLLVRGRQSDILAEEDAQHFLGLAPHARYADVTGAGHMVAGDRNDVFTRAVLDFLSEVRPA